MTNARAAAAAFAGRPLIALSALADRGVVSVVVGEGIDRLDIIVACHGGRIVAYENECPHACTPLETFDGRFLDADDPALLVCSTHGARFRIDDGRCIAGPCRGKALKPVAVVLAAGLVRIAER